MFINFFFFKQKTAYEMRISDWSSDVCSSDLCGSRLQARQGAGAWRDGVGRGAVAGAFERTRDGLMEAAPRAALQLRARLYALVRAYFAERNVLEVETPILSAAGNTEPNIESFSTAFSGHVDAGARERWLRTSPE